jgi:hypothetical protein
LLAKALLPVVAALLAKSLALIAANELFQQTLRVKHLKLLLILHGII